MIYDNLRKGNMKKSNTLYWNFCIEGYGLYKFILIVKGLLFKGVEITTYPQNISLTNCNDLKIVILQCKIVFLKLGTNIQVL